MSHSDADSNAVTANAYTNWKVEYFFEAKWPAGLAVTTRASIYQAFNNLMGPGAGHGYTIGPVTDITGGKKYKISLVYPKAGPSRNCAYTTPLTRTTLEQAVAQYMVPTPQDPLAGWTLGNANCKVEEWP